MRNIYFVLTLAGLLCMCLALPTQAQEPEAGEPPEMPSSLEVQGGQRTDPGGGMHLGEAVESTVDGEYSYTYPVTQMNTGMFLPDGQGGYVWLGSNEPMPMPRASHEAARELKLKIRELADQLFTIRPNTDLEGVLALPVSFVHQDNFQVTSSFGRYIAEQMYYELNQRGFPVREYRLGLELATREGQGEFLLSRRGASMLTAQQEATVALVGTYYYDQNNIFINARLVEMNTGLVLRTGLAVMQQNPVVRRMIAANLQLEPATVRVGDFDRQTQGAELGDIDLGYDVH